MKKTMVIAASLFLISCGGSSDSSSTVDTVVAPVDTVVSTLDSTLVVVDSVSVIDTVNGNQLLRETPVK